MPATVENLPLSWYVEKLKKGEPFYYLSYGDGEWLIATGMRSGATMQAGEVVTSWLEHHISTSLLVDDERIIRGTDRNLINWRDYKGGDASGYHELGREVEKLLVGKDWHFTDGTIWEECCQRGELAPLLRVLKEREVYLIGNSVLYAGLRRHNALNPWWYQSVPETDAAGYVCKMLEGVLPKVGAVGVTGRKPCFVLCCGLSAIPLALAIRGKSPDATVLDLGSSLDIFARIGEQRGWRSELYQDETAYHRVISSNLKGVVYDPSKDEPIETGGGG